MPTATAKLDSPDSNVKRVNLFSYFREDMIHLFIRLTFVEYFRCSANGIFPDLYGCSNGRYLECVHVGQSINRIRNFFKIFFHLLLILLYFSSNRFAFWNPIPTRLSARLKMECSSRLLWLRSQCQLLNVRLNLYWLASFFSLFLFFYTILCVLMNFEIFFITCDNFLRCFVKFIKTSYSNFYLNNRIFTETEGHSTDRLEIENDFSCWKNFLIK